MLNKKSIEDIDLNGKKVLVRCDFNVPLDVDDNTKITDDNRIIASLPTINYLIDHNAKVILMSHIGKTKDKKTLLPVYNRLKELLDTTVIFANDIVGEGAKTKANSLKEREVLLLENTRLDEREEANDMEFAKEIASLGEIFVFDAFGTAHRAHASTEGIAHFLPSVCGFLIQKELDILGKAIENPIRPTMVILGGSKISSKIGVITNLLDKADCIVIAGGMAYTFIKAMGGNIGNSLCEDDKIDLAKDIMQKAKEKGVKLIFPKDNIIAQKVTEDSEIALCKADEVPDDMIGLDIGPQAINEIVTEMKKYKTIIWNGTVGYSEYKIFEKGTKDIANALAEATKKYNVITIIGGGDTAAAVESFGLSSEMTHVSTGGGASLEFMEGKKLPGVEALMDK